MQPTYHQININMSAYMITHVENFKDNVEKITWMIRSVGGREIGCPHMDDYVRRGKKMM